ncbi:MULTISPECIES: hypothetical protein [unclassified Facklamia]|uniref:hypothetical protein n=1 Tax=Aerococcaceae TaxID=186827 RepID=UPI0013B7C959|nr:MULTISPECIES: hypothetical protein [unclassified Facklamia]NEW63864.1 hypothetical protein [Facklamia sp. 252]NEW67335.1 hypothetical protein [Facklamia sp. 253]QQD65212.1 hypothetical protein JDW14_07925 [Aerococcaceae bacterium zg-252]
MIRFIKESLLHFIKSHLFIGTIMVYAIFLYLRSIQELSVATEHGLFYFLNFMMKLDGVRVVLILILCFPMGRLYNSCWNSGAALFQLYRLGKNKFIIAMIFTVIIGTSLVTLLSQCVYSGLVLLTHTPLGTNTSALNNEVLNGGFRTLLTGNHLDVLMYYLIIFSQKIFEAVFYSLLTLIISIKVRDNYIICVAPMVLHNLINLMEIPYERMHPLVIMLLPQSVFDPNFTFERIVLEVYSQWYFNAVVIIIPIIYLLIFSIITFFIIKWLLQSEMSQLGKVEVIR